MTRARAVIDEAVKLMREEAELLSGDEYTAGRAAEIDAAADRLAAIELPGDAGGWRKIDDETPADVELLLYCPERAVSNPARIELAVYHNTAGKSWHAWATQWRFPPDFPADPS